MNNKVCILTSVHPPFDGRIFHKEAMTLLNAGYNVVLIAQHNKEEVVDGIKIIPLPHPINRFERITRVACRLFRLALKEKADVYHFHDPKLIPIGILLKVFLRSKIIYDVHEHYPNAISHRFWIPRGLRKIVSKLFSLFEKISVLFFDLIIYTTPLVGERYKNMRVPSERIENYPLIKLSDSFKKDQQKYIIYLGGMSKIRGIIELIKAFAIVIRKYPDWRLRLVGEITPEYFAIEVKKLISDLKIEKNIKLVGWVPYEKKEKYSSKASIGVVTYLPYANHMSCLPNKLFDYMLVSLPVVTSNFLLYREIVEDNKCGITVDPTNTEEISKAIRYLIEHPDEAKKMGENGKKAVMEKYNWGIEGKKLLNIYKRVLYNE